MPQPDAPPFTPSMPVPPAPVILSPEAIHGPLKIGPSVHQTETQRQAHIAEGRALLLAHGGTITAATPRLYVGDYIHRHIVARKDWDKLLWLLIMIFLMASAVIWAKEPTAPGYGAPAVVPVAEATGTLAEQVAALRDEQRVMREWLIIHNGEIDELQEIIGDATEPKEGQP